MACIIRKQNRKKKKAIVKKEKMRERKRGREGRHCILQSSVESEVAYTMASRRPRLISLKYDSDPYPGAICPCSDRTLKYLLCTQFRQILRSSSWASALWNRGNCLAHIREKRCRLLVQVAFSPLHPRGC